MKVANKQEAWNKVNEIFPTDYIKDEHSSIRAGYPVYRSTAEGHHCDYICDLGDRLEVNLDSSHLETVNIWIEHPAQEPTQELSEERKELAKRLQRATFWFTGEYVKELANKEKEDAAIKALQAEPDDGQVKCMVLTAENNAKVMLDCIKELIQAVNRHLLNYLPPVLREVLEFQVINGANEPEISLAWDAITRVLANQFLEDADEDGVAVWEQELRLYPKDTDTLEARKARIHAKWNLELPYVIRWLRNWLTGVCGPDGHAVSLQDYTLDIQLDYTVLPEADRLAGEILDMLMTVRPENIHILMTALLQSTGGVRLGAYTERSLHMDLWPLLTNELESTGGVIGAGPLEYRATLEIYPYEQEESGNA